MNTSGVDFNTQSVQLANKNTANRNGEHVTNNRDKP